MEVHQTLGVPAHRGGLLVRRSELTVGVVQAVARPSGLRIEVIARQPVDRRDATQRQRDIRARRGAAAPRVLLPEFDEGTDLRLGWLDPGGRARWEFPTSCSSWTGDSYEGFDGPSWRSTFDLPPVYDEVSLVLAWPEIGFAETVVTFPLPDRATVEGATMSIWDAPVEAMPAPEPLTHHSAPWHQSMPIEAGKTVAAPRVLHRGDHTVLALTRLTAIGSALSLELLGIATGARAGTTAAGPPRPDGPSVAVLRDSDAFWIQPHEETSSAGDHLLISTAEFTTRHPENGPLDLIVAWPRAQLGNAHVRIPL